MSECITQESFGNNKLSHFHITQWVRVWAEELISVSAKWASDRFAYPKPITKTLWISSQLINWSINQTLSQSVSQSVRKSVNQSNRQSVHQWIPLSQESVSFWVSTCILRLHYQGTGRDVCSSHLICRLAYSHYLIFTYDLPVMFYLLVYCRSSYPLL